MPTIADIDFTASTDIIVPISNIVGTHIKRRFHVTGVHTGLDTRTMQVHGMVKHFTLENRTVKDLNNQDITVEVEVPYLFQPDYPYFLTANEQIRVNADGSFDDNGAIGEYTWIRHIIKNAIMTSDEIVIGAILRQDALGKIIPR